MGARLPAFRQFVVKVHSRCNLACDHCYVYEHADQSWRDRPVVMAAETIRRTAHRIAEHCHTHELTRVHVVLHGGEPLLAGPARIRLLIRTLRGALAGRCHADIGIQTNGILLNDAFCDLFLAEGVTVGISLDGDRQANDRHRRYANGGSSHAAVVAAIERVNRPQYRRILAGLLCTIDPVNDPIRTYETLRDLNPPRIDFLLPHATWDNPPDRAAPGDPVYADWLLAIHDIWRRESPRLPVRTFDAIDSLLAGRESLTESLGLDAVDLVVIETDGAIEMADSLKTAYDGAPSTGFSVHEHRLDDVLDHAGFVARTGGVDRLSATCRACPVVEVCGGGLYAHRYRTGTGFENPSVYCDDLKRLITKVRERAHVSASFRAEPPLRHHLLSPVDFDALAAGGGDPAAFAALADSQRSLGRTAIADAVRALRAKGASEPLSAAWEVLCDLDERMPEAVAAVTAHPYVRRWAALSTIEGEPPDVAYLVGLALASSLRAGVPVALELPTRATPVTLPTLGSLRLPLRDDVPHRPALAIATEPEGAAISVDGQRHPLTGSADDAVWLPMRHLVASGTRMAFDDIDAYRDCYTRPATPREPHGRFDRWQEAFAGAWALIARAHPTRAATMASGLTLTPLVPTPSAELAGATHPEAFGAMGVSGPPPASESCASLALLLLHRFQHVKLRAVLELFELFDPEDDTRYTVGWRREPRPLEAVLQGTYANLVIVEFWRQRAQTGVGDAGAHAAKMYVSLRDQTRAAVQDLSNSASLTTLGRRWVEQMQRTTTAWFSDNSDTRRS